MFEIRKIEMKKNNKFLSLIFFSALLVFVIACHENKNEPTNESKNGMTKDSVLGYLDTKINDDTTLAEPYVQRAKYYSRLKQYLMAYTDMQKAIAIDSVNGGYHVMMGDILFFTGQPYLSKKALEKALQCDMNNEEALFKMSQLLFYVKEYENALLYVSRMEKVKPDDEKTGFLKGMIYKEKGDTALAIKTFQKCSEMNTQNYDALMQLGIIYGVRNLKLSLQYYDAALRVKPQSVEALYGKAMYYQTAEMFDEAIQTYTTINEIDPKFRDAYFNIGYIHLVNLKTYSAAIPFFDKAIAADSMYFQAFYNRGYCRELLGDINNAREDYRKALDANQAYDKPREALKRIGI